eukprot:COSAG03_NODE_1427_length_4098_cov_2.188797_3_plen_94_part_00
MPSYGVTSAKGTGCKNEVHSGAGVSVIRLAAHEGCRRRFGTLTYAPMGLSCVLATACRPTVTVSATASPQLVVSHVVKKLSIVRTHSKETFVK